MNVTNARVLWWAMEQQLWALSDLARLAYATDLLSGPDHLVLHGLIDQLTFLVRDNKEGTENAIPTQYKKR